MKLELIGYIATACSVLKQIPLAYHVYKTKDASSYSTSGLALWWIGLIAGTIYSLVNGVYPWFFICILNAISILIISIYKTKNK